MKGNCGVFKKINLKKLNKMLLIMNDYVSKFGRLQLYEVQKV